MEYFLGWKFFENWMLKLLCRNSSNYSEIFNNGSKHFIKCWIKDNDFLQKTIKIPGTGNEDATVYLWAFSGYELANMRFDDINNACSRNCPGVISYFFRLNLTRDFPVMSNTGFMASV